MGFHFRVPPFGGGEIAFGGITLVTTEHQIADATCAASRAWDHMIHLEGHLGFPTIDAAILVFEQEVGPRFPSCQCPFLVLLAYYLWVLEQLGIEADPLDL